MNYINDLARQIQLLMLREQEEKTRKATCEADMAALLLECASETVARERRANASPAEAKRRMP